MRTTVTPTRTFSILAAALILAGCAGSKTQEATTFDFGPAAVTQQAAATPSVAALVVMDATGPAALEN